MSRAALTLIVATIALSGLIACAPAPEPAASTPTVSALKVAPDIVARRAQFVQKELAVDVSHLAEGDRQALKHLVEAARVIDEIFTLQAWAGNPDFAPQVAALTGPEGDAARDYYRIMYGPWDRLKASEPFLGDRPHPAGAGYYPEDLTTVESEAWIAAQPDEKAARAAFTDLFTVIRRSAGGLEAVPYSVAYRSQLEAAAGHLRAAAAATDNHSLKTFLALRAAAFASDDYYDSDVAWMDLDSAIEVVIGPYETYEDGLFGYKAAFEAFICVVQPADSEKLAVFKGELPGLEKALPIPDEHKNFNRGSESPIRVADELFSAGDTRAGVQTLAFNLPNDERVREAKGSKKVLLKNVMHAKYEAILEPIAGLVLPVGEADRLDFDAYFHFILMHELSHGLGPGLITVDGRKTEVRLELKDLYSALEEAKADTLGALDLYLLADKGVVPRTMIDDLPWTYVAGLFRSARFGTTEAHGLGVAIQANYLLEKGAIVVDEQGRFRPVPESFPPALTELAHELLMIQALGSYAGAEELVKKYGPVQPAMAAALASLTSIPVDVDPVFPLGGLQ